MSMTDGHIFFDRNLFDKGQRPAINHALSVTRVGRQTQTSLRWSVNRELSSFFTLYTRTENFIHFGAEVSEGIRSTLDLGAKVLAFFNQPPGSIYSIELQILFICILWSGKWGSKKIDAIDTSVRAVVTNYENTEQFRTDFVNLVNTSPTLNALLGNFLKQYTKFEQYI